MTKMSESDVVVIGSGLIGSCAASCLATAGFRVDIIDKNVHPQFGIGESTLPPTSFYMTAIAERWRTPWIHDVAVASRANQRVAASSGVKKNFGFIYHDPEVNRTGIWHLPVPGRDGSELRGESHLYRPDVDAYLFQQALLAGCHGFPGVAIQGIDFKPDCVELSSDAGMFKTRFVIDASGFTSVVSNLLGLREAESSLHTRSRTVFTHMVGVQPFDDFYEGPRFSSRFHEGTLHHFFDGGWIWVIPFDNHPHSRNRLCSVGLNLDLARYPFEPGGNAVKEWEAVLQAYPEVAKQFEKAKPVRPWSRTGRIQYSNTRATGPRYWITAHAYGAVDALYSRGLLNSFQGLHVALPIISDALTRDAFDDNELKVMDELTRNALEVHDLLTYGTYSALGNVRLLGCWLGIWNSFEELTIQRILPGLVRYARSDDFADLYDSDSNRSHPIASYESAILLLRYAAGVMQDLRMSEVNELQAIDRLLAAGQRAGIDILAREQTMRVPTHSRAGELGIEHYIHS